MADISKVTDLNGNEYNIKDTVARGYHDLTPIATKSYTDVIATANDQNGAGFFYLRFRANSYQANWHIKTRVKAYVSDNVNYYIDTTFDIFGYANTYSWYACVNRLRSTSYRPIYYHSLFRVSQTGYNNGCSNWVGINLISATNNTNASYKRNVDVELLAYENCEVELQNSLITPTNIPNRSAHTDWYSTSNTSYDNFDALSYGLKQTGDANTTTISNLHIGSGNYIANSVIYRYQLLFSIDENTVTPLNNVSNSTATSKAMLTDVEFDPFAGIFYYYSTSTVNASANISGSSMYWQYSGIDARYTFNCGTTLTAHKPIYLVVTPTTNNKCKIASASPWTQTLPSTNDGKWYILLGRTYSTYQMVLYRDHPIYRYNGTGIEEIYSKYGYTKSEIDSVIGDIESALEALR